MLEQAKGFKAMAEQAQALVQQCNQRAQALTQSWEGVAETEFMQQITACEARLKHTPLMFSEISTALGDSARIVQESEQQAKARIAATIVDDTN
jgi:uncharacterized protein YukE